MNSELNVSFVMSANTIATIGGTSAQNVPTKTMYVPLLTIEQATISHGLVIARKARACAWP